MAKKLAPKLSPSQRKQWLQLLQPSAEPAIAGSRRSNTGEIYRVVVDTNIIISAILFGGKPEAVFRDVLTNRQLITSDYIVEEFISFLKTVRPRAPQKWLRLLRQKLESYCQDDDAEINKPVRDINDTPIVRLAIRQRAMVVTNDKDLLEYKAKGGVVILSVREYLDIFD